MLVMFRLKHFTIVACVAVLLLPVAFLPAYAEEGQDSSGAGATTTSKTEREAKAKEVQRQAAQKAAERIKNAANKKAELQISKVESAAAEDKLHLRAQELEGQARKNAKLRTEKERKDNCQVRKQGLEKKYRNLAANSQNHLSRYDSVLAKAVAYHERQNIESSAYDEALVSAQSAQAAATASVAALRGLSPTIDCNNETVASDVALFKAAVEQARADLSAYKTAIKSVLAALKNESES